MKLKEIFYLLGWKPRLKVYDIEVITCDLPRDGQVRFARSLHPAERHRTVDQGQVDALRAFLRPGDVAIDIGAQSGDTAVPMGLAVGPEGLVLALEPNPHMFPLTARNAGLNPDKTKIEPLMFAAAPEDGEIEFEYSDASYNNGGRHVGIPRWRHAHAFNLKVQGRNLQAYLRQERPDLIPRLRYVKVDTEGFDLTVLRSISEILREVRPFIRAEVYRHTTQAQREDLFRFLIDMGYAVHHFGGDAGYQGEKLSPADVMRWRHYDIFCTPPSAQV